MIDRWALDKMKRPLKSCALLLHRRGVSAVQVTLSGFIIGMLSLPLIALEQYFAAMICIVLNRICDGVDGKVARLTSPTDHGAFLDITFDFIFYSAVIFGFALADPDRNALAAAALIFSFIGTGGSFLAFAILAERRKISNLRYANKGFYYIDGITEGAETILFLLLFCLFPQYFSVLAWMFFSLCLVTTISRIYSGYRTLVL